MRVLDRYLLKGFLQPFGYCAALFSILFIVIDCFNNLDEYLRHGVTVWLVVSYYFFLMPSIVVHVVPIAALVAVLYVLSHLNRHNEIIAMKAGGIGTSQILCPYLCMGLVLSFGVLLFNETLVPPATVGATAIRDGLILKGKKNLQERAIKNVTLRDPDNRMIFARELELVNGTLHDVVVFEDNQGQSLKSKLIAKKARYENGQWRLQDAVKYRMNRRGDLIGEPVYSSKLVAAWPHKPEDFIKEATDVEFMNSKQLKNTISQMRHTSKKIVRRLWVEFHHKIALPFVTFIIMVVGAALAMRTRRGSAMVGIGTSLVVVLGYYSLESISLALGKGGFLPPLFAAWTANLGFAGLGIYLIKRST